MVAYRKGNTEQLDAKRRKWSVFVLFSAIFICLVSTGIGGCGWKKTGVEKLRDLDYTVVGEAELPEELKTEIEARKVEDFKMTYLLDDALYIVHGFGMQETGGYSIQVQALYLAENAIYFETDLIGPENGAKVEKCVSYPDLTINLTNYAVTYMGRQVDMPPKELELLYFLASSPNQVFTREQLLDHIWGYEYIGDTRTVDVHIKRLREKLKDNPHWSIATVWGIGYKFEVKNP